MRTFKDLLREMAYSDIQHHFYHGTSQTNGEQILSSGKIRPGNIDVKRGHSMTPIMQRTYFTPDIACAVIYAISGNYIGDATHPSIEQFSKDGRYCYVFVLDGLNENDIIIDEDCVGYILDYSIQALKNPEKYKADQEWYSEQYIGKWLARVNRQDMESFVYACKNILTPLQFQKVEHEYADSSTVISAGKKITKVLNPFYVNLLMKAECSFSLKGEISFDEAWKFDRILNGKLKKDASNFFKLAERIK